MSEQYIKMLMDLGLTYQEAKIYFALCIRGAATVSELSDLAEVPYTKTYDILNTLENKGLVVSLGGRPIKYEAVYPEVALKTLKENIENEYRKRLERFEKVSRELKNKLALLYERVPASRAEKLAILLKGRIPVNNIVSEMLSAPESVYIILTKPTEKRLLKYLGRRLKNTDFKLIKTKECEAKCNIVSTRNKTLIFLSIPDDKDLLSGNDIGILIDNKSISETFYKLLETLSKRGE